MNWVGWSRIGRRSEKLYVLCGDCRPQCETNITVGRVRMASVVRQRERDMSRTVGLVHGVPLKEIEEAYSRR